MRFHVVIDPVGDLAKTRWKDYETRIKELESLQPAFIKLHQESRLLCTTSKDFITCFDRALLIPTWKERLRAPFGG
jgi:hypothetical protein